MMWHFFYETDGVMIEYGLCSNQRHIDSRLWSSDLLPSVTTSLVFYPGSAPFTLLSYCWSIFWLDIAEKYSNTHEAKQQVVGNSQDKSVKTRRRVVFSIEGVIKCHHLRNGNSCDDIIIALVDTDRPVEGKP